MTSWWLASTKRANTPNWDIASTCTVNGILGLLLVEAKAHTNELSDEGKRSPKVKKSAENEEESIGWKNHKRIAAAILEASVDWNKIKPGWALSRDRSYQLANRFAWAWKIATLGKPVVLMYLGFLNAIEMKDQGIPFQGPSMWERTLRAHADGIVPSSAWENELLVGSTPIRPIIRSASIALDGM